MKVLLVNPPSYKGTKYVREGRCMQSESVWNNIWPPMSLLYIATILEKSHEIMFIDCVAEDMSMQKLEKIIKKFKPGVIVINSGFPSIKGDMIVASFAKAINKKIITVTFGIFPTLVPKNTLLEFDIDYAIIGEPEQTIKKLIDTIESKKKIDSLRGIAYLKDSKFIVTNKRQEIQNLDELPLPNRDLLNNELYRFPMENEPFALITLNRGCFYKCTYCVSPTFYGKRIRLRSAKNLVDEVEHCQKKYGINYFLFWGESFTIDKKYGTTICDEILSRNLDIKWVTTSRVDTLDRRLVRKMKAAGCYLLGLGIETPHQEILNNIKKGITTDQIINGIDLCNKLGLKTMGHFILGLPGETKKSIKETIKFAKQCGVDYAQFYCSLPYPGTEYGILAREKKWVSSENWDEYEFNTSIVNMPGLSSKEIVKYRKKAYFEFYFRPKFVFNHLKEFWHPRHIINSIKSSFAMIKWSSPKS